MPVLSDVHGGASAAHLSMLEDLVAEGKPGWDE
jgi:hypothetical protein